MKAHTYTKEMSYLNEDFTVEFEFADTGIGSYECHGFKGNQVLWSACVISVVDSTGADRFDDIPEAIREEWESEETENKTVDRE